MKLAYPGGVVTRSVPFMVSKSQYTQVYSGAPALTQPRATGGSGITSKLPWLVAGVAVLALLATFAYRRWL